MGDPSGRLIAVRSDVAARHLIDGLVEESIEREAVALPRAAGEALELVPAGPLARELAIRLARAGYATRSIETDSFAVARAPAPEIRAAMRQRAGDWPAAAAAVSAELAGTEPAVRPEPGDERAASWRIPGPGGHVRHHVALRTAQRLVGETPPANAPDPADLKRCWLYGFFVRCCEEAAVLAPDRERCDK